MKERPILFSGAMVRAILEGRKTQTRRVVKFSKDPDEAALQKRLFTAGAITPNNFELAVMPCPYGQVGDRLWVRETFAEVGCIGWPIDKFQYEYRADFWHNDNNWEGPADMCFDKWKPSIFMPRDASRIQLEITEVRVERLNDISDMDALQEGVSKVGTNLHMYEMWKDYTIPWSKGGYCRSPKVSFETLWQSINGHESWDENPWVWVVGFKRIDA